MKDQRGGKGRGGGGGGEGEEARQLAGVVLRRTYMCRIYFHAHTVFILVKANEVHGVDTDSRFRRGRGEVHTSR